MRDDAAPGPLTPASAPPRGPAKSQISWVGTAHARLGREDPRNAGSGTLVSDYPGWLRLTGQVLDHAEADVPGRGLDLRPEGVHEEADHLVGEPLQLRVDCCVVLYRKGVAGRHEV